MDQSISLLRKQLKKKRAGLTPYQQRTLSGQAVKFLQCSRQFRSARNIAIYLPVRGETDPVSLLRFANPRQQFYLPVLSPYKPHGLVFVRWNKHTRFRQNRFNIPEPLIRRNLMKSARSLDLVVTPLLAFDGRGSRLGMGGGFYDRSFAFKRRPTRQQQRPNLTGIAYQFQRVESLHRESWDVPLDAIATEASLINFKQR
ncbi:MAG: 5-formyltetrahydrofolate cyclo-ligase [Thiolinea sp.]